MPHSFKDNDNNAWDINLTIGEVMRIREESEGRFNLFDPESKADGGERTLRSIVFVDQLDDWATLWKLIWLLVEPQASGREKPLTAAEFGKLMPPDRLVEAQKALSAEWRGFFLQLQRHEVAVALEKSQKYLEQAMAKVKQAADDPRMAEIDTQVEAKMNQTLNSLFGNLQEELASILGPSPGGNSGT